MNLPIKSALASVASIAAVGAFAIPAHADSNSDFIHKTVTRSATHRIAYVKITVECSDDTDSAALSVRLTQVTPAGTVQQATGAQTNIGGFECTGDPESVTVAVRRPTGGYNWQAGTAVADHAVFVTHDPSGTYFSSASRRTVTVK
jgi:hypothetical protein